MNHYVYNVPGRLRVKTPIVKRKRGSARHVEELVNRLRSIKSSSVNTTTGSVVVLYDPKTINSDVILNALDILQTSTGYAPVVWRRVITRSSL